jgi:hypothetical protein
MVRQAQVNPNFTFSYASAAPRRELEERGRAGNDVILKNAGRLGAGPKWLPRKRLTAERLANAISRAVNDPAMKRRAKEVGGKIRAEDGLGTAIKLVEQFAGVYVP